MSNQNKGMEIIAPILDEARDLILEKAGPNLEALILVGSFSRDEGVVIFREGKPVIISDIEFMAVIKSEHYPLSQNVLSGECLEGKLRERGHDVRISIGQTTIHHLQRLKPYIFTVEIKKYGKVLWGSPDILKNISDLGFDDIDIFDGFILLNNRIVEQLQLGKDIFADKTVPSYAIDKGYIQIVNSFLCLQKKYRALYRDKWEAFVALAVEPLFSREDTARIQKAFENFWLGNFPLMGAKEAAVEWKKMREVFRKVWLYEASALLELTSPDLASAQRKFISLVPFPSRIKGWGKVWVRGTIWLFRPAEYISGLVRTSPQFLIYQDAVRAYFSDTGSVDVYDRIIRRWSRIVK